MSLTADRNTPRRAGSVVALPVAAATLLYAGCLACVNASGFLTKGAATNTLRAVGRLNQFIDNSNGGNGDVLAEVEAGVFQYDNSAGADELTLADVGHVCFVVDDATVAKTNGAGVRPRAGIVMDVDDEGVWLAVGDVAGGADPVVLSIQEVDLVSANAAVHRIVSPIAGTIEKIYSVLNGGALATGDATLTGKIGATAITTGALTITQVGSAAGDVDSAVPTAANVVAVGDVISFTVGGTNTGTRKANLSVLVRPFA